MAPTTPHNLPLYGVQLVELDPLDARLLRREKRERDPDGPTLEASLGGWHADEDQKTVDVIVAVKTLVPYRDGDYYLELDCSVNGRFVSAEARLPVFWDAFAGREALAVLWPYLRAAAGELGRMTGLPVPVLPTLDVGAIVPVAKAEAEPAGKGRVTQPGRRPRRTHASIG